MATFPISSGDPGTPSPAPALPPAPSQTVPSVLAAVVRPLVGLVIPVAAVPSQVLAVTLGDQPCRIEVYQRSTGLYLDLYVADSPVVVGVLCRDRNVLVVDTYRGFTGDLAWYDTQGSSDPYFAGLGTRWQLVYLS